VHEYAIIHATINVPDRRGRKRRDGVGGSSALPYTMDVGWR
jgi:hypothetical protein